MGTKLKLTEQRKRNWNQQNKGSETGTERTKETKQKLMWNSVVNLKTKILDNLFSQIYMIMLFMLSQLTLKYAWRPQFWRRYQKFWQNWEKIFVFFGKIPPKNEILPKKVSSLYIFSWNTYTGLVPVYDY